jgi:hypothetical protein
MIIQPIPVKNRDEYAILLQRKEDGRSHTMKQEAQD